MASSPAAPLLCRPASRPPPPLPQLWFAQAHGNFPLQGQLPLPLKVLPASLAAGRDSNPPACTSQLPKTRAFPIKKKKKQLKKFNRSSNCRRYKSKSMGRLLSCGPLPYLSPRTRLPRINDLEVSVLR